MKFFNRRHPAPKTNKKEEPKMMTEEDRNDVQELKEAVERIHKDTFEAIAEKILEYEFVTSSPIDGSPIGVVRTDDVLNSIAAYYGIDIAETKFLQYGK